MLSPIESRIAKLEGRLRHRVRGIHRFTDTELADLIAWLRDPDWSREGWAAALLQREGLIR